MDTTDADAAMTRLGEAVMAACRDARQTPGVDWSEAGEVVHMCWYLTPPGTVPPELAAPSGG
jgi:hypothetical protein